MQRRKFIKAIGSIGAATTLAGCGGSDTDDSSAGSMEQEGPLVVRSHRMSEGEYGNVAVTGRIENVSDRTISYVQVEASFFEGQTRIGSGLANINDLGPGRVWEFEALYMGMDGDRVTGYEFTVSP